LDKICRKDSHCGVSFLVKRPAKTYGIRIAYTASSFSILGNFLPGFGKEKRSCHELFEKKGACTQAPKWLNDSGMKSFVGKKS